MFWLSRDKASACKDGVTEEYQSGAPEGHQRYRTVSTECYKRETVVGDIMSQPIRTVRASQSLREAEDMMTELGIAHLAVLDKEQFSRLLSARSPATEGIATYFARNRLRIL